MSPVYGDPRTPSEASSTSIRQLQGPILVLGASGFIGANLLRMLLEHREDVYGTATRLPAWRLEGLPRAMVGINWLVLMALRGGPRFAYRLLKDGSLSRMVAVNGNRIGIPVLLIGAGEGADLFIRTVARDPQRLYRVVGMIADGAQRVGRDIGGVPVLGTVAELADIVKELDRRGNKPQRLILSGRGVDGAAVLSA